MKLWSFDSSWTEFRSLGYNLQYIGTGSDNALVLLSSKPLPDLIQIHDVIWHHQDTIS